MQGTPISSATNTGNVINESVTIQLTGGTPEVEPSLSLDKRARIEAGPLLLMDSSRAIQSLRVEGAGFDGGSPSGMVSNLKPGMPARGEPGLGFRSMRW